LFDALSGYFSNLVAVNHARQLMAIDALMAQVTNIGGVNVDRLHKKHFGHAFGFLVKHSAQFRGFQADACRFLEIERAFAAIGTLQRGQVKFPLVR
jgi:hypothetical protein